MRARRAGHTVLRALRLGAGMLAAATVWGAAPSHAEEATVPARLLYARPFRLAEAYRSRMRADTPSVTDGYLVVVEADPALTVPRQVLGPILFVGEWPVEVFNTGSGAGRVVAVVPELVDLAREPVFYAQPEALPEVLAPAAARASRRRALGAGAVPAAGEVAAALAAGGAALDVASRYELSLRAADLVEIFAPDERDVVSGLRAPLVAGRMPSWPWRVRRYEASDAAPRREEPAAAAAGVVRAELGGRPLRAYPFFEATLAVNQGDMLHLAADPGRFPQLVGETADLYVVAAKTTAEWNADPSLDDVSSGGAETVAFTAGTVQDNTFLVDSGTLSAAAGTGLGVGYDLVIDVDQDGQLSAGDLIDGYDDTAGIYAVHDTTQSGPLSVTEILYSGGSFLGQNTFYPTDIGALEELPLVVVSHGNGHNYQWYDHIGFHLASYGYIVMSHENNTQPGIESASTTTLTNTDYFLGNLDVIAGGVLEGHVDSSHIVWIGHSRGGEGIVRAYDRIFDGDWEPVEYTPSDLRLLSSIAPTVFLSFDDSNPHQVPYHAWVGAADADVHGCVDNPVALPYRLLDRARGLRQSIALYGVGHGDFHNGGGSSVASGPCLIGRPDTHVLMRGYLLPLVERYLRGNRPAVDFLWRQWEGFHPIGAPTSPCVVVNLFYAGDAQDSKFVIDDFESQPGTGTSSSGGSVSFTVSDLTEGMLDDGTSSFTHSEADAMNGMTVGTSSDETRGIVFTYDRGDTQTLEFEVPVGQRNLRAFSHLTFRAAQATRHPSTTASLGDTIFTVTLVDELSGQSSIGIGAYGGGVEEPYQRTGCGTGPGWNNEFESVRLPLTDFLNNGSGLDLSRVESVLFRFGPAWGSSEGRIGFDQLEVVGMGDAIFADGFESGDTSAWSTTVD